ncbi:MAG: hypothetical protein ACP5M9_03735, partial [Candidatus Micrarchaeia archaeon]
PQVVHQKINIIEELSVRGRKRGVGLLIATQRPSNISKNVLSQCSYGFIGKLTIENDLNAISQLFSNRSALDEIVNLNTGEFMPFGIQIKDKFKVKPTTSFHMGSTPQITEQSNKKIEISSLIKELTKEQVQAPKVSVQQDKNSIKKDKNAKMLSIPVKFDYDYAKEYSNKISKKALGIFGKKIESVKAINLIYMPFASCLVNFPTKNKREFEVFNIFLDDSGAIIKLNEKVSILPPTFKYSKLTQTEENILYAIKSYKKLKFNDIIKKTGIKPNVAALSVRSLLSKKLITEEKEKYSTNNSKDLTTEISYISYEEVKGSTNISGKIPEKKKIELYLRSIFPKSELAEFKIVYLPYYEIILSNKNKIRIFKLDAFFGKEINYIKKE